MEKQKRWHLFVILAVLILTFYNILPTVIYYMKPLSQPIDQQRSLEVVSDIEKRLSDLESETLLWVENYAKTIQVYPKRVTLDQSISDKILVEFTNKDDAKKFIRFFDQAQSTLAFTPKQMRILEAASNDTTVALIRQIPLSFIQAEHKNIFTYIPKKASDGQIDVSYYKVVTNRAAQLLDALFDVSSLGRKVEQLLEEQTLDKRDSLRDIAYSVVQVSRLFGPDYPFIGRWIKSTFGHLQDPMSSIKKIRSIIDEEKKKIDLARSTKNDTDQDIATLTRDAQLFKEAGALLSKYENQIVRLGKLSHDQVQKMFNGMREKNPASDAIWIVPLKNKNPFFKELVIDWANDQITLRTHDDIRAVLDQNSTEELLALKQDAISKNMLKEVNFLSEQTSEKITQDRQNFCITLVHSQPFTAYLGINTHTVGQSIQQNIIRALNSEWSPESIDLKSENFPRFEETAYAQASNQEKKLCAIVYVPSFEKNLPKELHPGSIYVVLKGMKNLIERFEQPGQEDAKQVFTQDFQQLAALLKTRGFIGYPGSALGKNTQFSNDFIFEREDFVLPLARATREEIYTEGDKEYIFIELTNLEKRLKEQNRIEDQIQEELLHEKERYEAAQVDANPMLRMVTPPPSQNTYIANFKRALSQYIRGNDKLVLKWGLDLSGGKSVRVALFDQAGRKVEGQAELNQASNELYNRLNKMGVSERVIRQENDTIAIDFPGASGLSARELIQASSLTFHIVNEKFSIRNKTHAQDMQEFMQEIWNEAVIENKKDIESLNEIAFRKFENVRSNPTVLLSSPLSRLIDAGLQIKDPKNKQISNAFDDSTSIIARMRGDDINEWLGQNHPLMIVFANYALDGGSLENIQVSFDPLKGNILTFNVKSSNISGDSPRDSFYSWTSQFSEEKIAGTDRDNSTNGQGWRMAVLFNNEVISAPTLHAALRDSAMISGNFSQREVSKLAQDLKAGALTFTPKVLSEYNVSPELGKDSREKGIFASILGVLFVLVIMLSYYRFAGVVASVAVLFNVLIIWAVMQNIEAPITLAGLAGIVLTVGMAVDANVLVFERIREEFSVNGRIAQAIQAGYRKAFSAIVDSNLTTILAALILVQFDSGPIKGFAITLMIGILASMFTALFMTRYFFGNWVQNAKNKELKMAHWIRPQNFNFLAWTKKAFIVSGLMLAIGGFFFAQQSKTIFGMDFTGGYALIIDLDESKNTLSPRESAAQALVNAGCGTKEIQIQELGQKTRLRIQLSRSLNEQGRPFAGFSEESIADKVRYSYEKNPRITWIVQTLEKTGLSVKKSSKEHLEQNWTQMSGQFSEAMRTNALIAIIFSLIGILVYIAIRFEWKYALSSVLALVHDVVLTVSIVAIAHAYGAPIEIDLQIVGALMTIIGYSLNDTIIVFDRIREERLYERKKPLRMLINHALNVTLSRTVLTSGTTLAVLLPLVLFGGSTIFGFAFVMMMGVFLGTFSSLFIAAPLLLFFEEKYGNFDERDLAKI